MIIYKINYVKMLDSFLHLEHPNVKNLLILEHTQDVEHLDESIKTQRLFDCVMGFDSL
jgi:hypothetical protein